MQTRPSPSSGLPAVRDRLRALFGPQRADHRLDPLSQLIRSVLGLRTYDEAAWSAFIRLRAAWPDWGDLAEASAEDIEPIIDPVAFPDQKARQIPILLRVIRLRRWDLDLDFLGALPEAEAMGWLRSLPGVNVATAAATLNHSRLGRRVLSVDPHLHRVARRLGLVRADSDAGQAYAELMGEIPAGWSGDELFELHNLMRPLGQSICSHLEPSCGLCVLRTACPRVGVAADQVSRVAPFALPEARRGSGGS